MESFDKKSLDSAAAFITFYDTHSQILCEKLVEARTTITSTQDEIIKISQELDDLEKLYGESSSAYYEKYVCLSFLYHFHFDIV